MRYFELTEFTCKCGCGRNFMDSDFLERLDRARELAGIPFTITSGFRCEKHNRESGGKLDSAHLSGHAADIATPTSGIRFRVLKALLDAGFRRIGWNAPKKFVHVDSDPQKSQDVAFDY